MIESLKHIDTQLFLFLNGKHNAFFDFIMYWASNKWIWIPFYVFLVFLVIRQFKSKGIYVLLAVGVLITLTDQLSVRLFKNVFERLRPCHNPEIKDMVHILHNHCGGAYGFVSSHATSVFGLAFLITFFLRKRYKALPWIMFIWAAFVSYSRVYLGTHYPGDLLCGALFGVLLAFLTTLPFRYVKALHFY